VDGLISFLIMMWVVSTIVKKLNKGKKKTAQKGSRTSSAAQKVFSEMQSMFETSSETKPVYQAKAASAGTAAPKAQTKKNHAAPKPQSYEGLSRPLLASEELMPGRAPGSLAYHSTEGEDACDPSLSHGESSLSPVGESLFGAHGGNGSMWNASEVVRGVVMSEILTRPSVSRWNR